MAYQHILFATDFAKWAESLGRKAKELADLYQAELTLLHIVEFTFINLGGDLALPPQIDIEAQLMESGRKSLADLAAKLNIQGEQMVEVGVPKHEIVDVAKNKGADLIIMGSHGRSGLARLIGSTAEGVVHSAHCDVLAVRVTD